MKTCKTCKFWTPCRTDTQRDGTKVVVGECDFCPDPNELSTTLGVDYGAYDDSGLYAQIVTGPDFGCVHHEEK